MSVIKQHIRAVVFDLGGVLLEINPARCFNELAKHSLGNFIDNFKVDEPYKLYERGPSRAMEGRTQ